MKIHEIYKCKQCNEFHSSDYDQFIRQGISYQSRNDLFVIINHEMTYSLTDIIRRYKNARNPKKLRTADRHLDDISSRVLQVESRIPSNRREHAMMGRFYYEFCRCVCKAIGTNKETCLAELKNRSGYEWFRQSSTAPLDENGKMMSSYHNFMDVFSTEPHNQWTEITELCTVLSVNPSWFSGHRVYQFPVRVNYVGYGQLYGAFERMNYECKITTNNQNGSVLKFAYRPIFDELTRNQLGYFLTGLYKLYSKILKLRSLFYVIP